MATRSTLPPTDLLILRRREPGRPPQPFDWATTSPVDLPRGDSNGDEPTRINTWWQTHPEMVLGQMRAEVGLHGVFGLSVAADLAATPARLEQALSAVVREADTAGLAAAPPTPEQQQTLEQRAGLMPAAGDEREGHITTRADGTFTVVESGVHVPLPVPRSGTEEMRALLTMRDQARTLLDVEARSLDDTGDLDRMRSDLLHLWEQYRDRYGAVNRFTLRPTGRTSPDGEPVTARIVPTPVRKLMQDPYGPLVTALESFDEVNGTGEPAGILVNRQIEPRRPILGADSALDALNIVLDQQHDVDLEQIARLTGQTAEEVRTELGTAIWEDPASPGSWLTRAEYLSGDVRVKFDQAQAAAADDPDRWSSHLGVLEAALPAELGPEEIQPRLGASWISDDDHQQFLRDLLGSRSVTVSRVGAVWSVKDGSYGLAKITSQCKSRHRHQEFLAFLKHLARAYPDRELHLVMDNYATHKRIEVRDWLAANPRIHVHFTPTSGSWLNLVEVWFGIIERQAIRRGTFTSVRDLVIKIRAFITGWNTRKHPFIWTKPADELIDKISRKRKYVSTTHH